MLTNDQARLGCQPGTLCHLKERAGGQQRFEQGAAQWGRPLSYLLVLLVTGR
jgi:hypothetical protein